ncbi:MAG: DUF4262 domain-containing protein [Cyanobacteria bacterium P01_F01_bin.4]
MHALDDYIIKLPWSSDPQERAVEQQVVDHIREAGCHLMGVYPDSDADVEFVYSVGLWANYGFPEAICLGLPARTGGQLINSLRDCLRAGERPDLGQPLTDFLANDYAIQLEPVQDLSMAYEDYVCWAGWFYQEPVPIVRLCWPDREGRFPWEPECNEVNRQAQNRLS